MIPTRLAHQRYIVLGQTPYLRSMNRQQKVCVLLGFRSLEVVVLGCMRLASTYDIRHLWLIWIT